MSDLYRQCSKCYGDRLIDWGPRTLARCDHCDAAGYVKAEPCEHGNYARHILDDSIKVYSRGPDWEWCDGKPNEDRDVERSVDG